MPDLKYSTVNADGTWDVTETPEGVRGSVLRAPSAAWVARHVTPVIIEPPTLDERLKVIEQRLGIV